MDGVGTPIIGRPRPLPGHDTPNPAYHPHTLNYEEPVIPPGCSKQTATDEGRKVFLISNGQIWQGRAELVCSPDMAAYPTPVSTW